MTATDYERAPSVIVEDRDSALAEKLRALWETEPGFIGWLSSVDHKEIGIRYIITAFAFLIVGGIEALIFRLQLSWSNLHVLSPEQYDQLFSTHGMTMIFLYAGPVLSGFSNYLWPLLLGARDMALPRLNALSYWIYLCAGIFLYTAFAAGFGPNDGWFNYVPYAARAYNNGPNIDFYSLGMVLLGISTTVGSINFIVTFLRMRAPGMSINRVPILVWGTLTASAANIFAIPAVSAGLVLDHGREAIGTDPLDAQPDIILKMPSDSLAPLVLSIAATCVFIGLVAHWWVFAAIAAVATGASIIGWLWPEAALGETAEAEHG